MKVKFAILLTKLHTAMLLVGVLVVALGLVGWEFAYEAQRLNPNITEGDLNMIKIVTVAIGIAILVFGAITFKPINNMRNKAREDEKYDEYGRLKGLTDYSDMSVSEQKAFDEERRRKMNQVLPISQVRQMTVSGSSNPEHDMNALIGLKAVKDKMEEMTAQMEFEKKHNVKRADTANHMNMFGPPGTGKTTVARIMAGFLYQNGYIKRNEVIETSGSFFTTGDAATKAEAICQYAYGGVLFIDEAYAMAESTEGQEAIAALIKEMEDSKDKFILILAGYENEMKRLLNSNPGFLSRIKEHFYFENYSIDELAMIFEAMAKSAGYQVSKEALDKTIVILNELMHDRNFGNARTCRNVLDKSISRHALNVKKGIAEGDFVIGVDDIAYNNSI